MSGLIEDTSPEETDLLYQQRHTLAHLLASAVQELLPEQWEQDTAALLKELRAKAGGLAKLLHVPPKRAMEDESAPGAPKKPAAKLAGNGNGVAAAART